MIFGYDVLGNLLSVGLPNGDLVEYLVDAEHDPLGALERAMGSSPTER